MVRFTEPAGIVPDLGREDAEGRGQWYIGPEHLLVGLLRQDDNPAATLLREHGLDLATVRAGIDRLVGQGVLPGPRPDDAELLATLGIDPARPSGTFRRPSATWPTTTRPGGRGCGRSARSRTRR
jgi:hypothetical protein